MAAPIRVLIVDDSAFIRSILSDGLDADPEIDVVATAADPYMARDRIEALDPDVMTLDIEMPRMNGIDFLRKLIPQHPMPVIVVSSMAQRGQRVTFEALKAGAIDFVPKPGGRSQRAVGAMIEELREKVKTAATSSPRARLPRASAITPGVAGSLTSASKKIIAIGSSTGGPEALMEVIRRFPPDMPGCVVVQHIPAGFTRELAKQLDAASVVEVHEAAGGERIRPGQVLIAPGGLETRIVRLGDSYRLACVPGQEGQLHCPSVDALMASVAANAGKNAIGVILTGMGRDGAKGLVAMRAAGARTIGQDRATSVVYGMPAAAARSGAVERVAPLQEITETLIELLRE